jgi:NADH-quinone oxidoreductase subunit J
MTLFSIFFYVLAIFVLVTTGLAVTRRNAVHAVVWLILSFFGTALLFYLLGAPFLALLEVIIYAGAIMVLFLFIIMMVQMVSSKRQGWAALRQWLPAMALAGISLLVTALLIFWDGAATVRLKTATAAPAEFGRFLFQGYWFAVELVSFLLLIALVGALYLGRRERKEERSSRESL